jgi:hypothetical protein
MINEKDAAQAFISTLNVMDTPNEAPQDTLDTANKVDPDNKEANKVEKTDVGAAKSDSKDKKLSEEETWKKRHSDLKSYADKEKNTLLKEKKELEEKLAKATQKQPSILTPDELATYEKDYPDLFKMMESVFYQRLADKDGEIKSKLEEVDSITKELKQKEGLKSLLTLHPDAEEIAKSDEWAEWYEDQTPGTQADINSNDVTIIDKVIKRYKAEKGIETKAKTDTVDASKGIDTKGKKAPVADSPSDKIWTDSEVAKLSDSDFKKLIPEIDKARKEGRYKSGV